MRNHPLKAPTGKRLRNLNARQRKKMHVGEFQQFICEVRATLKDKTEDEALLVALIDMVESRGLLFGGSVGRGKIDGIVFKLDGSPADEDRQAVLGWLQQRPEVEQAEVGEPIDSWYGSH